MEREKSIVCTGWSNSVGLYLIKVGIGRNAESFVLQFERRFFYGEIWLRLRFVLIEMAGVGMESTTIKWVYEPRQACFH